MKSKINIRLKYQMMVNYSIIPCDNRVVTILWRDVIKV